MLKVFEEVVGRVGGERFFSSHTVQHAKPHTRILRE